MRLSLTGLVAAIGLMTAGAAPAMACGFGGCSPCAEVAPCAQSYVPTFTYAPAYSGCGHCGGWGGGWGYEHLAMPTTQYYHVNQGPVYSGPGEFAPEPVYEENAAPVYRPHYSYYQGAGVEGPAVYGYHHYRWHHYYRPWHHSYRYGYAPRHYGYAPRQYGYQYGYHYGPSYYGHRVLRRYY
jgi:hypothetical protein